MKQKYLESVLKDALLNGTHDVTCALRVSSQGYLPSRHPGKLNALKNIADCNCWKKRALRIVRAISCAPSVADFASGLEE